MTDQPKARPLVLVDMDGVAADFVAGACEVHNQDPATATHWNWFASWDGDHPMTQEEFWNPINARGESFWRHLKVLPGIQTTLDQLEEYNVPWRFLTSCADGRGCYEGKREWAREHFGHKAASELIATTHKGVLAAPGRLLIDDKMANVEAFEANGGDAILWPQPWNAVDQAKRLAALPAGVRRHGLGPQTSDQLLGLTDKEPAA